jgi:hypothetical protein
MWGQATLHRDVKMATEVNRPDFLGGEVAE